MKLVNAFFHPCFLTNCVQKLLTCELVLLKLGKFSTAFDNLRYIFHKDVGETIIYRRLETVTNLFNNDRTSSSFISHL